MDVSMSMYSPEQRDELEILANKLTIMQKLNRDLFEEQGKSNIKAESQNVYWYNEALPFRRRMGDILGEVNLDPKMSMYSQEQRDELERLNEKIEAILAT